MTILKKKTSAGERIKDLMALYRISQRDLVRLWNISPGYVCDIVHGRRGISPRIALKLEATFGDKAELWMKLQAREDLNRLREEMHDELMHISAVSVH